MKKFFCLICSLMLLSCVSTASAEYGCGCGHDNWNDVADTVVYLYFKQYSDTHHYQSVDREFTCLDCGYSFIMGWITDDLLPHQFSGNKCTQCGYVRSSTDTYTKEDYMTDLQKAAYQVGDKLTGSTAKVVYAGEIRAKASNTAAIVGYANEDDTYRVTGFKANNKRNVWLEIEYKQQKAWISAGLVKIMLSVSEEGGAMPELVGATVVVRVDSGYGCDAPRIGAAAVRTVVRGQKYKILDCAYDSRGKLWYKINVNEQECWIASGCMAWP